MHVCIYVCMYAAVEGDGPFATHFKMFSMPSSATLTIRTSGLSSKLTRGGTHPCTKKTC
jgi:hypothetical protein